MACPFFLPTERLASPPWPHPSRLPLGAAWAGRCTAPNSQPPDENALKNGCNLGYARSCPHLPQQRSADALRVSVRHDRNHRITLQYVFERDHLPAGHGLLEYDLRSRSWLQVHPDACTQRMAECYLESYLLRRNSKA